MCPIRISPEVPAYISEDKISLRKTEPTTEPQIIGKRVFVVPGGKSDDCIVEVDGYAHDPGGILETERATTGHDLSCITLTIPDDSDLSGELGLSAVKIDRILYEAEKPVEDNRV
jgi:hypothetical protein